MPPRPPSKEETALHMLMSHLKSKEEQGLERIWLGPESLEDLNRIPALVSEARSARTEQASTGAGEPGTVAGAIRKSPAQFGNSETDSAPENQALKLSQAAGSPEAEQLKEVAATAEAASEPRAAGTLRDTMVFATGNPRADLMFVGEAPGMDEERLREPFVGKAGQLLTKIITTMGLQRADVYISNIVKFRPAMPNQGSGNRKPTPEEMATCLPFVRREIEIVRPTAIVALGATAAEGLLGLTDSVGRMRQSWHEFENIPVRVTYHPSYLLRNGALSEKRKVWEDLLLVMERMGLPITEKQRGFFLKK